MWMIRSYFSWEEGNSHTISKNHSSSSVFALNVKKDTIGMLAFWCFGLFVTISLYCFENYFYHFTEIIHSMTLKIWQTRSFLVSIVVLDPFLPCIWKRNFGMKWLLEGKEQSSMQSTLMVVPFHVLPMISSAKANGIWRFWILVLLSSLCFSLSRYIFCCKNWTFWI